MPIAGILLISAIRSFLPIQLVVSLNEPLPQLSIPLVIAATLLSVTREILIVIGFVYLGRLAKEIAEPVDFVPAEPLREKAKRDFQRLAIGWSVATIWMYAFLTVFLVTTFNESSFLTDLPTFVRRVVIAGPSIIKVFVTWSVVLVLYQTSTHWHALGDDLQSRFDGD